MTKYILFILSLILVTACGIDDGHFKLDGRLLNLNQGEFLIYSPDGAMPRPDTIHVEGGRFELITECVHEGTALIVMPNGMEMAIFVKPGASLSLRGDVQNLLMAEVTGTEDNEVMSDFRKQVNGKAESAMLPFIKDIIAKHPDTAVGPYLIRRYMLSMPRPDYPTILKLLDSIIKEQKNNTAITAMRKNILEQQKASVGTRIPSFNVKDIEGKQLSTADVSKDVCVIAFWSTWDYDSFQQLRSIYNTIDRIDRADGNGSDKRKTSLSSSAKLIAVSLDASVETVKNSLSNDKDHWTTICDAKMTEGTLPRIFAVSQTGTVIVLRDGFIIERSLTGDPLCEKLREILK